jgi:hypothetical protein
MHPYISSQIRNERQREKVARAQQQNLARRLLAYRRAERRAVRADQRMRRAVRRALRLRTELES